MKMQMWTYQSVKNPEQGFTIQEHNNKKYSIWIDEYEAGFAYDTDWRLIDESFNFINFPLDGYFSSFDESYKWIVENYGEIIDMNDVKKE